MLILRRSNSGPSMSLEGHFRQIDPLPTLSACPLRSDLVRTFAPQRNRRGGRLEDGRGSLGHAATLRFPSPLIEPDVRISRIRLSDWLRREAHGVVRIQDVTPRTHPHDLIDPYSLH
jgi:hypothetical protein